ncbi:hypothetical protein XELAEV_18031422mg [Xenopus laevis]|uniref:DOMON domain-containing protein n=1 Tax=Xenopus laevis TaxID=8355 RepID=A0A974CP75_XENLA|nr:hypothetical protein XELAEV_18031422mg [Xenopus laevis]
MLYLIVGWVHVKPGHRFSRRQSVMILLCQSVGAWLLFAYAVSASPADESATRGSRRDKGDPALDEKHQDTYGTFASEFYDLRYLSEEGYPFPTAPPVDPFARIRVDDCGKTKGCFRSVYFMGRVTLGLNSHLCLATNPYHCYPIELSWFTAQALGKKSNFIPTVENVSIEMFEKLVVSEVKHSWEMSKKKQSNMTKADWHVLKSLKKNTEIIIKKADKGGAIVVMDKDAYITEAMNPLQVTDHYEMINYDPVWEVKKLVDHTVLDAEINGVITKEVKEFLLIDHPVTPVIYFLPKIHKSTCLKDTSDLVKLVKLENLENVVLASIDIQSLYTSIPQEEGIRYIEEALLDTTLSHNTVYFILDCLQLVLSKNYFRFGDHQNIKAFFRFVDDILILWSGSKETFQEMIEKANNSHKSIKFTFEYAGNSINFLDITITNNKGKLGTNMYRKPMDRNNLLRADSFHHPKVKKGIPKGQFLRARRLTSDIKGYKEAATDLIERFTQNGSNKIESVIKKYWPALQSDMMYGHLFKDKPLFSYKRGRTLRDNLRSSDFRVKNKTMKCFSKPKMGTFPCLNCGLCNSIIKGDQVAHPFKGFNIPVRTYATCESTRDHRNKKRTLQKYGKPGCNAETCDYFLSYRRIGADVEFELSADTEGWVAVGFSSDKKMTSFNLKATDFAIRIDTPNPFHSWPFQSQQFPTSQGGDDVMACVHDDNGRVRIQHFYNVGQWAKEIKRNPARDEEGVFENNRVTCRFKRPVYVPRDETIVDLHLSWYYLFAWGPAIQGSITRHDIDSPPVSENVVSIYRYEDIFMPSAAYQTFSSPFCLLLIVALTFYLLMGTP